MNARLDKSGDRILCTRIDCGKELAMARAFPDGTRYVLFGGAGLLTAKCGCTPGEIRLSARDC
jgi:hypothetical protein